MAEAADRDRISALPDAIVHHVMSFLPPRDVARVSALSKRWRSLSDSFPILRFDQATFEQALPDSLPADRKHDLFLTHLDRSRYKAQLHNSIDIYKLKIHARRRRVDTDPGHFDPLIELAVDRNVRELDLGIIAARSHALPPCLYSAKSVTSLKLGGFALGLGLKSLLEGCTSIEELVLQRCGLGEVKISSSKLKIFKVENCEGLNSIELDTPNLWSFRYNGYSIEFLVRDLAPPVIVISACLLLRNLSLKYTKVKDEWLEHQVSKLVHLENLTLDHCTWLTRVGIIRHKKLKTLQLLCCKEVEEVEIDCRNLRCFVFVGNKIEDPGIGVRPPVILTSGNIKISTCVFLRNLSLKNAKVSNQGLEHYVSIFAHLQDLSLDSCTGLTSGRIRHEKLKTLQLVCCKEMIEVKIDCPKLHSFLLEGNFSIEDTGKEVTPPVIIASSNISLSTCITLRNLSLKNAKIEGQWLEHYVSKLLNLEDLLLDHCAGLTRVNICHEKLKILQLFCCKEVMEVEIDCPKLHQFLFDGNPMKDPGTKVKETSKKVKENGKEVVPPVIITPSNINLSGCIHLKNLSLKNAKVTDQLLEHHIYKLVHLEDLSLDHCAGLTRVRIRHEKLKAMHLLACKEVTNVEIDCPQLRCFAFEGVIPYFGLLNTSGLLKATLTLSRGTAWCFFELRELLGFFDHCDTLNLVIDSDKDMIFPDELRYSLLPPLHDLKYLAIEYGTPDVDYAELVDNLLWLSPHLETLYITPKTKGSCFLKFEYKKIFEGKDDQEGSCCCRSHPGECWQHCLKKVVICNNFASPGDKKCLFKYFCKNAKALEPIQDNSSITEN